MGQRRAKWLTVGPLVSVFTRWARRLIGGTNEQNIERPIELSEEEAASLPPAGYHPGAERAAHGNRSWGPKTGESV